MQGLKLFKKFLMPCGLCAATPVIKPAPPPSNCPTPCELDEKKLIRPSELPIYTLGSSSKVDPCTTPVNYEPSYLEQGFGTVRKSVSGLLTQYQHISESISDKIETGVAHTECKLNLKKNHNNQLLIMESPDKERNTRVKKLLLKEARSIPALYEYLKEESNTAPRLGAIGIGALTGLVFGLRGGAFKKTLYATTGALVVASICYPKQAREGVDLAKHYANIGYNFAYGVKPDDPQLEISFPEFPKLKMPTSFDGLIDQVIEKSSVAGEAIGALASKASDYLSESTEKSSPVEEKLTKT